LLSLAGGLLGVGAACATIPDMERRVNCRAAVCFLSVCLGDEANWLVRL
jgi:hypothetical protein